MRIVESNFQQILVHAFVVRVDVVHVQRFCAFVRAQLVFVGIGQSVASRAGVVAEAVRNRVASDIHGQVEGE